MFGNPDMARFSTVGCCRETGVFKQGLCHLSGRRRTVGFFEVPYNHNPGAWHKNLREGFVLNNSGCNPKP